MSRWVLTRLAVGELSISGDKMILSCKSSSRNGSVASDSGLAQPLLGAENAELPHDEIDESEKEEQTDPERSNAGLSFPLLRLSLIRSHSLEPSTAS